MDLRPYAPTDQDGCLAVFDSFASPAAPRADFLKFLQHPDSPYFVMQHNDSIVGCGGYVVAPEGGQARLIWGMIRSDLQRQGLGRFLLMYRLREIGKLGDVQMVHAAAPQQYADFFERQGFRVAATDDGQVELLKKLTVCA
jgi:N-acetylglutamate synthase-like GNAT family acetyltransferase